MTLESKELVAISTKKIMESLCHICAYGGCTNCPSLVPVRGRSEEVKDFPQIKEATKLVNGKIIVHSCQDFYRIKKEKEKNQRAQYEWDIKQRKFVKVIK